MTSISLDYDGTYTADPELYLEFTKEAILRGHKIYVVTMRYPSELASIDPKLVEVATMVIPTSRQAKRPFVKSLGIEINIWVDDNPRAVEEDASQIWPLQFPEGQIHTPEYN